MPRYKKIYSEHALEYDQLVAKEDYQGNILRAIEGICSIRAKSVIEFGAGTGRITGLLAPIAKEIHAFDAFPAMLEFAETKFRKVGIHNVSFALAENKSLPVSTAAFDVSVAGWTLGHCTSWHPDTWRDEVSAAVKEMLRVLRPSGTAIILETLGTGHVSPLPPNEKLAQYYELLEKTFGFSRVSIRTDYRFVSLQEAMKLTKTFFGREYDFILEPTGEAILPECTGVWCVKKTG